MQNLNVKLVDTAGTLRLDMNDRRVHMTREQALALFVALGAALDYGQECAVNCSENPGVRLSVADDSPAGFAHVDATRDGEHSVYMSLSRESATKAAIYLVSVAREIKQ